MTRAAAAYTVIDGPPVPAASGPVGVLVQRSTLSGGSVKTGACGVRMDIMAHSMTGFPVRCRCCPHHAG